MNAGDAIHRVNPDEQWDLCSQEHREVNTSESLESMHLLESCTLLFDVTFAGLAEGVNQKKGLKYENGSACLK